MPDEEIQLSGALFEAVQRARIFPDSKSFPDSAPRGDPQAIAAQFAELLADFVAEHFDLPAPQAADVAPGAPIEQHIDRLWDVLTRPPDARPAPHSTRIALPHRYLVPGGRFRESYYWDTYFSAVGLVASGRLDLLEDMLRNFASLIDRFGHIPNGNRTYYLSRSQPPFFVAMLELMARERGLGAIAPFLPQLEAELRFWRDGAEQLAASPGAHRRCVGLAGGVVLGRYWDDRSAPREESHAEDVELYERAPDDRRATLYRDLRAAAESGWDFSSRWIAPSADGRYPLEQIRTTAIIPVDLNCLLYLIELRLSEWLAEEAPARAAAYAADAARRRDAILGLCWDAREGWFCDYLWAERARSPLLSLAGVMPLFVGIAEPPQADAAAARLRADFLRPGGLVATLVETGQQWDAPNGWAPLQWLAVQGLRRYGHTALADEIAQRFGATVRAVYAATGKLMEKYDVCHPERPGGGGEYPNQDGFGWTNGVVRAM